MTWGMFLSIPCPFRRWDERARGNMMVCLPFIGAVVGGIWALTAWILERLHAPNAVAALALAALPWLTTGWIHLDGYMDVCDAVLSRRDLDTRRKILKDSHCGAFAVISLVLLALAQWSFFLSADRVALLPLALIPVATRACAGLAVVSLRPIETSQYAPTVCGASPASGGWSGLRALGGGSRVRPGSPVRLPAVARNVGRYLRLCADSGRAGRRCSFDVSEVMVWISS